MLIIETWVTMVGDGPAPPTAAAVGRSIPAGGSVATGGRWLVQLGVAKASLKPALSSATRVEGPTSKITRLDLVPRLQNNLHGILQNPDHIFQKV